MLSKTFNFKANLGSRYIFSTLFSFYKPTDTDLEVRHNNTEENVMA